MNRQYVVSMFQRRGGTTHINHFGCKASGIHRGNRVPNDRIRRIATGHLLAIKIRDKPGRVFDGHHHRIYVVEGMEGKRDANISRSLEIQHLGLDVRANLATGTATGGELECASTVLIDRSTNRCTGKRAGRRAQTAGTGKGNQATTIVERLES